MYFEIACLLLEQLDRIDQDYTQKCAAFSTQKQAQSWYEQRKKSGQTGWKSLDRDGDGHACDCLPGGNGKKCPKKKK